MGGTTCKTEEERIQRRRASALKSYHKCKGKHVKTDEEKQKRSEASLKYYYKNKQKCIDNVCDWRKVNVEKVKQYSKRAYQKRVYDKEVFFIKIQK